MRGNNAKEKKTIYFRYTENLGAVSTLKAKSSYKVSFVMHKLGAIKTKFIIVILNGNHECRVRREASEWRT